MNTTTAPKLLIRFENLIAEINTLNNTTKALGSIRLKPLFTNYNSCIKEFKASFPKEFEQLILEDLPLYDENGNEKFIFGKLSTLLHQSQHIAAVLKGLSTPNGNSLDAPSVPDHHWFWKVLRHPLFIAIIGGLTVVLGVWYSAYLQDKRDLQDKQSELIKTFAKLYKRQSQNMWACPMQ